MHLSADYAGETVAWLQSRKINTRPLLDELGIDRHHLKFGHQISARQFAAILDYGALKTRDAHFGLHRGSDFQIKKNGGVLAYLAVSAETVCDAILNYQRYASVVCDGFSLEIEYDDEGAQLFLHVSDPVWRKSRHLGEFTAARTIAGLREITGVNVLPIHVYFMHPRAVSTSECRRLFRCSIDYGARADTIKLSNEAMAIPIPTADSRLGHMLRSYADGLLHQVRARDRGSLKHKVANIIAQRLASGEVSLRDVAARLNLGERTLRRRLRESHVSFSDLLMRVRLNLANDWLMETDFDLKHISFLLGYSEPAAFSRAYKRWTGRSPRRSPTG
jgi:AraC-like DNA-binding protein